MSDYRARPGTGTGIHYDAERQCWRVKVYCRGVRIDLGRFGSLAEAKEAYESEMKALQEADAITKAMRGIPVTVTPPRKP